MNAIELCTVGLPLTNGVGRGLNSLNSGVFDFIFLINKSDINSKDYSCNCYKPTVNCNVSR